MRGDPGVERVFPVQALGDGFNDQIAFGNPRQIVVVVGAFDQVRRGVLSDVSPNKP